MRTNPNEDLSDKNGHTPERKCVLTGAHDARDRLIRLALGPDGVVAPDIRARAPGRGAWIGVDRVALEEALARGKLKGALARAFKARNVSVPEDLGARIEAALRQAALDRLGLEAKAGFLITGAEKIETAARSGKVALLLHAADAGADGRSSLDQAWRVGGANGKHHEGLVLPVERTILSLALGRQNVVHVAIINSAAATRVQHVVDRWLAFIGNDGDVCAASAGVPGASAMDLNEG